MEILCIIMVFADRVTLARCLRACQELFKKCLPLLYGDICFSSAQALLSDLLQFSIPGHIPVSNLAYIRSLEINLLAMADTGKSTKLLFGSDKRCVDRSRSLSAADLKQYLRDFGKLMGNMCCLEFFSLSVRKSRKWTPCDTYPTFEGYLPTEVATALVEVLPASVTSLNIDTGMMDRHDSFACPFTPFRRILHQLRHLRLYMKCICHLECLLTDICRFAGDKDLIDPSSFSLQTMELIWRFPVDEEETYTRGSHETYLDFENHAKEVIDRGGLPAIKSFKTVSLVLQKELRSRSVLEWQEHDLITDRRNARPDILLNTGCNCNVSVLCKFEGGQ